MIGVLGALAFANENAHQSWSAVFVHDELDASIGLASTAPAVFAAIVAVTRFSISGVTAANATTVLLVGSFTAATGATIIALAPTLIIALLGLGLGAAGTGVLFPTLVGLLPATTDESHRGRATAVVTAISYLGFVLSPVYVGAWAGNVGLRVAMLAIAALGAALFILTPALLHLSGFGDYGNQPDGKS